MLIRSKLSRFRDLEMSNDENGIRTPPQNSLTSLYNDFSEQANEYREYVQTLAGQWPGLSYLDAYLQDARYLNRETFTIGLVKPNTVPPARCNLTLEEVLFELDGEPSPTLIVLEEPTPRMVAELGGKLGIDPQFWADFLVGPAWFGSGKISIGSGEPSVSYRDDSLLEQLWPLPKAARQQEHSCFRFVARREPTSSDNCVGPLMNDYIPLSTSYPICGDAKPGPPICANSIELRKNLTIWENTYARDRAKNETPARTIPWISGWLGFARCVFGKYRVTLTSTGVIAVNNQGSRLPVCKPRPSYIFREFLPRPRFGDPFDPEVLDITKSWEGRPQHALRTNHSIKEILCYHLFRHLQKECFIRAALTSPSLLLIDILQLIGCFWVAEIESRHLHLSWMEVYYQTEVIKRRQSFFLLDPLYPNPNGRLSAKLQADMIGLHSDLIDIEPYQQFIKETEEYCKAQEQLTGSSGYKELANDFTYLQGALSRLTKRTNRVMGFLRSIEDEFEKARSRYRNMLLLILAVWAWLVSPVSVTTSILNLGENSGSKADKVGDIQVFWKIVVPLAVGVILLVLILLWVTEYHTLKAARKATRSRRYR